MAPGAEVSFRCSRCRHVFDLPRAEPAIEDADEFAFDDEEGTAEVAVAAAEADDPVEPSAPPTRTPARFALRALLGVTFAYAILSVYLATHPESARRLLARLPVIGARLVEARLDPASVRLTKVRGEYQRVRSDHLVFVVSGTAVNASPVAVRGIQIRAYVSGAQLERQIVFCGAAPRDVQDLSLREIALLQTLEPPKDWALGPDETTSCLVVFPDPPADAHEFGAEVVAVRASGRGA